MSRAYRVSVKESIRRVVSAEDHVSSQLEMLDILPCDQMADLLAVELIKQGFERDGDTVARVDGETKISVDLKSGTVTVSLATSDDVEVSGTQTGSAYDDAGSSAKQVKEQLAKQLIEQLEGNVSAQQKALQKQVTDQLEGQLADLRKELDQAANRATAQALKQKAAQIGQIKELTEDPETGSMTIIVEV
jgi:FtsH ternary system domain X5